MAEVDLLKNYPKTIRNLEARQDQKTAQVRNIARKFGKDYFDGERIYGYGGFKYFPRFWSPVVPDFMDYYGLTKDSKILDVGCAKGFMLHDFRILLPEITVKGIDISPYAIENSIEDIKPFLKVGNATELPFEDNSFDLVISINTVHNLKLDDCKCALKEIQRVSSKHAFITVDAWRNDIEKKQMEMWNLTALTYMHVNDWKSLFDEVGYKGDYYWFLPC